MSIPIGRLFRMLLGFACSVVAISVAVLVLAPVLNYALADEYAFRDFLNLGLLDGSIFVFVTSLTLAVMGFVPWAVFSYVAETKRKQGKSWFMWAGIGVATAWISVGHALSFDSVFREVIYGDMGMPGTREMAFSIFVLAVVCGALGGFVYWGIAGRHSGDWNSQP